MGDFVLIGRGPFFTETEDHGTSLGLRPKRRRFPRIIPRHVGQSYPVQESVRLVCDTDVLELRPPKVVLLEQLRHLVESAPILVDLTAQLLKKHALRGLRRAFAR